MAVADQQGAVLRQLRRLFGTGTIVGLSESQLLEQFLTRKDEVAFQVLVERHGPLVLAVCRQFLHDAHDVEDAFQATFLVLVQKAGSIRRRQSLASWLYGVAYRVAIRARAQAARRRSRERPASEEAAMPANPDAGDMGALKPLLVEELSRLPEKYRQPLVLCYLEGQTHEQAADQLSWPVGTVRGRLARARDLLRRRLVRRGVTMSALALGTSLSETVTGAPLPPALIDSTVRAAMALTGRTAAAGAIAASVTALTQGVMRAMFLSQLKSALVAGGLLLGVAAAGAAVLAYQDDGGQRLNRVGSHQEGASRTPEAPAPNRPGSASNNVSDSPGNNISDSPQATEWELRLRDELEILQADLRAREAELQKAHAQLQLARAVAARFQRLAEGHAVSADEATKSDADRKLAMAEVQKRIAELDEAKMRIVQMQRRIQALHTNRSGSKPRDGVAPSPEWERRLKELELRVDELTREVQNLKRAGGR